MIDIMDLTYRQLQEIAELFNRNVKPVNTNESGEIADDMIGRYCIIRTYSAGVWYGKLYSLA